MDELGLYQSSMSIGGDGLYDDFTITDGYGAAVDPSALYQSATIIGGAGLYGDFTITDGYGNPADPAALYPSSMTLSAPTYSGGDLMSSLLHLYALAPAGSIEQAQILQMMDSVSASTAVWTLPDSADVDRDRIPDWNDPYVPYAY